MRNKIINYIFILILLTFATPAISITFKFTIHGLQDNLLDNTTKRLKIAFQQIKNTDKISINNFIKNSPTEIQQSLYPFGFFKPTIKYNILNNQDNIIVNYFISPGPILLITNVSLLISGDGKTNQEIQKATTLFPLKNGIPFDAKAYKKAKNEFINTIHELGFIKAQFSQDKVIVDIENYTCNITMILDTGIRYYFGDVSFQQTPISEKLLKRYIPFENGTPYSSQKAINFQETLGGTGYFDAVNVVSNDQQIKGNIIPLQTTLSMKKRKAYQFGAGFGTDTGPRIQLGYNLRWLNSAGHKLAGLIRLSKTEQALSTQYTIPGANPASEQYAITGLFSKETPKNGEGVLGKIGFSKTQNFTLWQANYGLNYQYERYSLDNSKQFTTAHLLTPIASVTRVSTDDYVDPQYGTKLTLNVQGASKSFLSNTNFFQAETILKWITTLADRHRFVLFGDIGYTMINDSGQLPLSYQYYAGGLNSIRGYGFKTIGPGKYLLIANAEYQLKIYDKWSLALFYDTGNASNNLADRLKQGIGFGVLRKTKIGLLRAYLGTPVGQNIQKRSVQFEFSIGPDL